MVILVGRREFNHSNLVRDVVAHFSPFKTRVTVTAIWENHLTQNLPFPNDFWLLPKQAFSGRSSSLLAQSCASVSIRNFNALLQFPISNGKYRWSTPPHSLPPVDRSELQFAPPRPIQFPVDTSWIKKSDTLVESSSKIVQSESIEDKCSSSPSTWMHRGIL